MDHRHRPTPIATSRDISHHTLHLAPRSDPHTYLTVPLALLRERSKIKAHLHNMQHIAAQAIAATLCSTSSRYNTSSKRPSRKSKPHHLMRNDLRSNQPRACSHKKHAQDPRTLWYAHNARTYTFFWWATRRDQRSWLLNSRLFPSRDFFQTFRARGNRASLTFLRADKSSFPFLGHKQLAATVSFVQSRHLAGK